MTTVLTREYLDARPDGWLEYAAKRIAQLYDVELFLFISVIFIISGDTNAIEYWIHLCYLCFLTCRGADKCYNRTLCEEHLNLILPAKPPFRPRQFKKCAVVGNSGDLLKTEFGEEIDSHDAVIRDNEAPVNQVTSNLMALLFPLLHLIELG